MGWVKKPGARVDARPRTLGFSAIGSGCQKRYAEVGH